MYLKILQINLLTDGCFLLLLLLLFEYSCGELADISVGEPAPLSVFWGFILFPIEDPPGLM
jgi:hypothetical protein